MLYYPTHMDVTMLDLWPRGRRIEAANRARTTRPGMSLVEVEGAVIRIRESGQADSSRTVVLVPDPPNVIEHYDQLFSKLEEHARVICFELPGFGFSVAGGGFGFSLDEYADASASLMKSLGVSSPVIVWAASCLPAYVGFRVATRHPGALTAMVAGQAPSWDEQLRWARRIDRPRILSRPVIGQLFMGAAAARVARGWYEVAALPSEREWIEAIALDALARGASYSLASSFQRFASGLPQQNFSLPTVFVWGTLDRTHRKTDRDTALEVAPDATIVELKHCAHFPDLEAPSDFARLVDQVAESCESRADGAQGSIDVDK